MKALHGTAVAFVSAILGSWRLTSTTFAWDGWVNGDPDQFGAGARGYFVWHNDSGWQLRTHNDPGGAVYGDMLHTDGIIRDVDLVRPESTEHLSVGDGGHTIRFGSRPTIRLMV